MNYPDNYQAPTSGVILYDAAGDMQRIVKDENGDEVIEKLVGYSSLQAAYQGEMTKSLTRLDNLYGMQVTQQQLNLVDASMQVLAGTTAAFA